MSQEKSVSLNEPYLSQFDEFKNNVSVESIFSNRRKKFWWICDKGHSFEMPIYNRTVLNQNCCYCTNRKLLKGFNDLKTVNPGLAAQWADETTQPDEVFLGTVKRYKWRCKEGHIWKDSPNHRKDPRRGCPFCSNHRALAGWNDVASQYPVLFDEWASEDLDPTKFTYGSKQIVAWKCSKGHNWNASIISRTIKNTGCQECRKTNQEEKIQEKELAKQKIKKLPKKQGVQKTSVKKFYINKPNVLKNAYQSTPKKLKSLFDTHPEIAAYLVNPEDGLSVSHYSKKILDWRCPEGHEFSEQVGVVFGLRKHCPICTGRRLIVGVTDLATTDPELAKQLLNPENAFKCHRSSNKEFEWKCPKGHQWKATVNRRSAGCDCPVCSNKKVIVGINDLWTTNPDIAEQLVDTTIGYKVTYGSKRRTKWKCTKGHVWEATIFVRVGSKSKYGTRCPKCSKSQSYLEKLVLDTVCELYLGDIKSRKRPIRTIDGKQRELDIWLPDLNLAFEVQDFNTHSKTSDKELRSGHLYSNDTKGNLTYKHGPAYHAEKRKLAKDQLDVDLYEIWEDEILDGTYRQKVSDIINQAISCQKF